MRITVREIASQAGVSPATVSLVLNNKKGVSEQTRRRVQEVLDIAGQDIEQAPQFDGSVHTNFILGMGKIGDSVKILLDIDAVLGGSELSELTS